MGPRWLVNRCKALGGLAVMLATPGQDLYDHDTCHVHNVHHAIFSVNGHDAVEAVRKEMGNVALHEMAARPHCPVSERNHYERIPPTHVVALDDVWLVLDVVGRWGGADAKGEGQR